MQELIETLGPDAIWLKTHSGQSLEFVLAPFEEMPLAVHAGDVVEVLSHPRHPVIDAMEAEAGAYYGGYYDLVHVKSGLTVRTLHHRP